VGRVFYLGNFHGRSEQNNIGGLNIPLALEKQKEEYPRLPPAKIKSEDKPLTINWVLTLRFSRKSPSPLLQLSGVWPKVSKTWPRIVLARIQIWVLPYESAL